MPHRLHVFFSLFLFGILLALQSSFANDFYSPRTAALGGAARANPILNDSLYLNPAFASFLPSYSFSMNWTSYRATPEYGSRNYNVSVVDGRSPLFQAGLGYTVKDGGAVLNVGASKAIIERMGIGLGGKFFIPRDAGVQSAQDIIFGLSGLPIEWFQFAFVIENLLQSTNGKAQNWYRDTILATKFNVMGIFSLSVDGHYVPEIPTGKTFGYALGAEFKAMSDLYLRIGMFRNTIVPFARAQGQGSAFGLGWVAPRMSLDYAFTRVSSSPLGLIPQSSAHQLGTTMFF